MGSDLSQKYQDYQMGRKEWERSYTQGLDLLGFKYDMRTEPFQGAWCNSPSSCRSGYSVSSVSLQRITSSRWSS